MWESGLCLIFNSCLRYLHVSFFKLTMGHNFDPILREESDLNPLIRMWSKVYGSPLLNHKFS
jgi:hypothetical protein